MGRFILYGAAHLFHPEIFVCFNKVMSRRMMQYLTAAGNQNIDGGFFWEVLPVREYPAFS